MTLAQVVKLPGESEIDDRACLSVRVCGLQDGEQHSALRVLIVDVPEGQSERMCHEARQRRLCQLGDLGDLRDRHRRHAVVVEHSLQQSDRLLADRSSRHEESEIDGIADQGTSDLRARLAQQWVGVGDVPHEAIRRRRDLADQALVDEFPEEV